MDAELLHLRVVGSAGSCDGSWRKGCFGQSLPLLQQREVVIMNSGERARSESDLVNLNCRLVFIGSDVPRRLCGWGLFVEASCGRVLAFVSIIWVSGSYITKYSWPSCSFASFSFLLLLDCARCSDTHFNSKSCSVWARSLGKC